MILKDNQTQGFELINSAIRLNKNKTLEFFSELVQTIYELNITHEDKIDELYNFLEEQNSQNQ